MNQENLPDMRWIVEVDGMADERLWFVRAANGELIVEAWNDARTAVTRTFIARRGATINSK